MIMHVKHTAYAYEDFTFCKSLVRKAKKAKKMIYNVHFWPGKDNF